MQVCRQCSEILRQETTTFNSKEGVDRIRISSSDAGEGATCSYRTAHRRLAIAAWERLTFVCGNSSCNWSYGYLSSCKRHFQRAHTASEQLQYKCHINGCRRSEVGFFDISSLNRHVRHCHTDKKSMGRLRSIVEPKPPVTSEWRKHKKVWCVPSTTHKNSFSKFCIV